MRAAGVETLVDMSELSVIGFSAVVNRLPRILRALRLLRDEAARFKPHGAILVDSPGFNFRLGPALHRAGIPVFYYIAPQVWAWQGERAKAMAAWVRQLAVVFPFEEALFRDAGVTTSFVGHPLLEELAAEVGVEAFREELGITQAQRVLGLLPGSRGEEIRALMPVLSEAATRLCHSRPDLAVVLPLAPGVEPAFVAAAARARLVDGGGGRLRIERPGLSVHLVCGRTRSVMSVARACAVASGTATLETALLGTPLVVAYRVGALNYWIARRVVHLERIGLPNIVAGESIVPECIQHDCTAERIQAVVSPWLDDDDARAAAAARLARVRERLGEPGAAARTAALVLRMVT